MKKKGKEGARWCLLGNPDTNGEKNADLLAKGWGGKTESRLGKKKGRRLPRKKKGGDVAGETTGNGWGARVIIWFATEPPEADQRRDGL